MWTCANPSALSSKYGVRSRQFKVSVCSSSSLLFQSFFFLFVFYFLFWFVFGASAFWVLVLFYCYYSYSVSSIFNVVEAVRRPNNPINVLVLAAASYKLVETGHPRWSLSPRRWCVLPAINQNKASFQCSDVFVLCSSANS